MKLLLLFIIKLYWRLIPSNKRRKCIFRTSCSNHVYQITKDEGFSNGLKALTYRYKNCRSGFQLFDHPMDHSKMMILPNGQVIGEEEIAEILI